MSSPGLSIQAKGENNPRCFKARKYSFSGDGDLKLTDFDFFWAASKVAETSAAFKEARFVGNASMYAALRDFSLMVFPAAGMGSRPGGALQADLLGADHRSGSLFTGNYPFEMLTGFTFRKRSGRAAAFSPFKKNFFSEIISSGVTCGI